MIVFTVYLCCRIGEILHHQGLQCSWPQGTSRRYPHNDIEERFESIVEANDMLLERIVGSIYIAIASFLSLFIF